MHPPDYGQLNSEQQRNVILGHIRAREAQHLEMLINITILKARAERYRAMQPPREKEAAQCDRAVAQLEAEATATLAGIEVLQTEWKGLLGPDADGSPAPADVVPVK